MQRAIVIDGAAPLAGTRRTRDGYLVAEARVARTGIQIYTGAECGKPEIESVRVYRPAAEVFARDTLASYAYRPVTAGHPENGVSADTWRRDAIGAIGGDVVRDGDYVRVPLVLMDRGAVQLVESGTREVSMGYDCDLDWTPGVTDAGEPYDAIQRGLVMNHLAVVERGRAGPACRIGDVQRSDPVTTRPIKIGDTTYVVPEAAAAAVESTLADATRVAAAATASRDAAIAERDAAIAARDAAVARVPTPAQIDALASERAALVTDARRLKPDVVTDGATSDAIRAAVVTALRGATAVDGRSADYVRAAFDTLAAKPATTPDPVADALSRSAAPATDAVDPRAAYLARIGGAWKG